MIALQRQPAVLIGTGVPAVGQGLGDRTSTPTAHLRCASRVHDDHNHSSLFRFEGEDRQELVPAGIGNTLGQAVVAHHVVDAQALDGDGSVPINDLAGRLVMEVEALVADAPMCFGYQQIGFAPVLAAALLAVAPALSPPQKLLRFPEIARIVLVAAVSEGGKVFQAHVDGRGRAIRSPNLEESARLPQFFSAFLSGAGTVAGRHGYDLVWLVSVAHQGQHDGYARAYLRREVDGLLLTDMLPSDPRVRALQRTECPLVIVGRYDHAEVYTVDVDNLAVGYLATRSLLALGHTRIALLNGQRERLFCQDRYAGFVRALAESGLAVHDEYLSWRPFSEADGYEATRRLLSLRPRPTALIVTDTALQSGCLRALHEAQLHIPEHCSLVGVANALSGSPGPPITAVVQPVADLAAAAAQLLLQLIAGEHPASRHRVLHPLFVDEPSTTPPPRL
jgi:LacI family transcriptional regulator